jgi:hypothetical protein
MAHSNGYRKRAEECVQLAQTARTPQQRTMLLHIAETWLRLAEDAVSMAGMENMVSASGWDREPTLN